ncbi:MULTISPECIES: sulfatase [Haloferax]|nr:MULTISPECIES: sulfatase [Haloferax]
MDNPNVIILVLDSLRFDYVSPESNKSSNTPNIGDLITDGTYIDNVYSSGSWTVPAHGSLFTGKLPSETGIGGENRRFDAEQSIAQIASDNGYTSIGASTNPWITDDFGFDRGFDVFEQSFPELPFGSDDPRSVIKNIDGRGNVGEKWCDFIKWTLSSNQLARVGNSIYSFLSDELPYTEADQFNEDVLSLVTEDQSPFFLFANYMDAHEPYMDEDELGENVSWNLESLQSPPTADLTESLRQLYADDVQFLDRHIGEFFDRLRLRGMYDDSLIVLLGDHGQSLGENEYWGHGTFLYESLVKIPLVIKPPSDMSPIPDIPAPTSITDLFDFLFEVVNGRSDQIDFNSIFGNEYVVTESYGPHESLLVDGVSSDGYRGLATEDCYGIINLSTADVTTNMVEDSCLRELESIIESKKELTTKLTDTTVTGEVDQVVEQRLEQLGYK